MTTGSGERLIVIGSGPAAWTAAVCAARANLQPVVYEGAISEENRVRGTLPLGQLNYATYVENFPGFPAGVLGPDLMVQMRGQAERYGARIVTDDVVRLELSTRPFVLTPSETSTATTQAVILAMGGRPRQLAIPSLATFTNRGFSADAASDGPLPRFRNRPVAVIGGGDSAASSALYLARFSHPVYLIHRRAHLRAIPRLVTEVTAHPRIRVVRTTVATGILGTEEAGLQAILIKDLVSGSENALDVAGLFAPIGCEPNTNLVRGQVEIDSSGCVARTNPPRTSTSVDGVFAAGEVADPVYRQAVTAAAMGCQAALDAERWLAVRGVH